LEKFKLKTKAKTKNNKKKSNKRKVKGGGIFTERSLKELNSFIETVILKQYDGETVLETFLIINFDNFIKEYPRYLLANNVLRLLFEVDYEDRLYFDETINKFISQKKLGDYRIQSSHKVYIYNYMILMALKMKYSDIDINKSYDFINLLSSMDTNIHENYRANEEELFELIKRILLQTYKTFISTNNLTSYTPTSKIVNDILKILCITDDLNDDGSLTNTGIRKKIINRILKELFPGFDGMESGTRGRLGALKIAIGQSRKEDAWMEAESGAAARRPTRAAWVEDESGAAARRPTRAAWVEDESGVAARRPTRAAWVEEESPSEEGLIRRTSALRSRIAAAKSSDIGITEIQELVVYFNSILTELRDENSEAYENTVNENLIIFILLENKFNNLLVNIILDVFINKKDLIETLLSLNNLDDYIESSVNEKERELIDYLFRAFKKALEYTKTLRTTNKEILIKRFLQQLVLTAEEEILPDTYYLCKSSKE
jgi:hypothetical protein